MWWTHLSYYQATSAFPFTWQAWTASSPANQPPEQLKSSPSLPPRKVVSGHGKDELLWWQNGLYFVLSVDTVPFVVSAFFATEITGGKVCQGSSPQTCSSLVLFVCLRNYKVIFFTAWLLFLSPGQYSYMFHSSHLLLALKEKVRTAYATLFQLFPSVPQAHLSSVPSWNLLKLLHVSLLLPPSPNPIQFHALMFPPSAPALYLPTAFYSKLPTSSLPTFCSVKHYSLWVNVAPADLWETLMTTTQRWGVAEHADAIILDVNGDWIQPFSSNAPLSKAWEFQISSNYKHRKGRFQQWKSTLLTETERSWITLKPFLLQPRAVAWEQLHGLEQLKHHGVCTLCSPPVCHKYLVLTLLGKLAFIVLYSLLQYPQTPYRWKYHFQGNKS